MEKEPEPMSVYRIKPVVEKRAIQARSADGTVNNTGHALIDISCYNVGDVHLHSDFYSVVRVAKQQNPVVL